MTPSPPDSMPPLDMMKIWQFPENSEQAGLIKKCIALEGVGTDESCDTVVKLIDMLNESLKRTLPVVRSHITVLELRLSQLQNKPKHQMSTDTSDTTKTYPCLDEFKHARNRLSFPVGGLLRGFQNWESFGYPGEDSARLLTKYAQVAVTELKRLEEAHRRFLNRALQSKNEEVRVLYWLTETWKNEKGPLSPYPTLRNWHQLFAIGTKRSSDSAIIMGHRWNAWDDSTTSKSSAQMQAQSPSNVRLDPPRQHRAPVPISIMLESDVEHAVAACEDLHYKHGQCRVFCFHFLMKMCDMGVLLNHNAGWHAYQHLVYRNTEWPGYYHYSFEPDKFVKTLKLWEARRAVVKAWRARTDGKDPKMRDGQKQ